MGRLPPTQVDLAGTREHAQTPPPCMGAGGGVADGGPVDMGSLQESAQCSEGHIIRFLPQILIGALGVGRYGVQPTPTRRPSVAGPTDIDRVHRVKSPVELGTQKKHCQMCGIASLRSSTNHLPASVLPTPLSLGSPSMFTRTCPPLPPRNHHRPPPAWPHEEPPIIVDPQMRLAGPQRHRRCSGARPSCAAVLPRRTGAAIGPAHGLVLFRG